MKYTIIIFISILFESSWQEFASKYYRAEIERYVRCDEKTKLPFSEYNLQVGKYNRTHKVINGFFNSPFDIGRDTEIDYHVRKWGDGGWKNNFYNLRRDNLCETGKFIWGKMWIKVLKMMNVTHPERCPLPKGRFEFKNLRNKFEYVPFPLLLGEYEATVKLYNKGVLQICSVAYGNIKNVYKYKRK